MFLINSIYIYILKKEKKKKGELAIVNFFSKHGYRLLRSKNVAIGSAE